MSEKVGPVDEVIARNLRRIIDERKVPKKRLVDACGWTSRSTLYKTLNATRPLRVNELLTLALVLDVPPMALLLPRDGDPPLAVTKPDMVLYLAHSGETSAQSAFAWLSGLFSTWLVFVVNARLFIEALPASVRALHGRDLADLIEQARDEGYGVSDDGETVTSRMSIPASLRTDEIRQILAYVDQSRAQMAERIEGMTLTPADQRNREGLRKQMERLEARAQELALKRLAELAEADADIRQTEGNA